uniref:(northern house mosquito) hypothetical protein n=1 Tax=Culex pipiens TaxID=7175 RepID=A0A8D8NM19_CULPI
MVALAPHSRSIQAGQALAHALTVQNPRQNIYVKATLSRSSPSTRLLRSATALQRPAVRCLLLPNSLTQNPFRSSCLRKVQSFLARPLGRSFPVFRLAKKKECPSSTSTTTTRTSTTWRRNHRNGRRSPPSTTPGLSTRFAVRPNPARTPTGRWATPRSPPRSRTNSSRRTAASGTARPNPLRCDSVVPPTTNPRFRKRTKWSRRSLPSASTSRSKTSARWSTRARRRFGPGTRTPARATSTIWKSPACCRCTSANPSTARCRAIWSGARRTWRRPASARSSRAPTRRPAARRSRRRSGWSC